MSTLHTPIAAVLRYSPPSAPNRPFLPQHIGQPRQPAALHHLPRPRPPDRAVRAKHNPQTLRIPLHLFPKQIRENLGVLKRHPRPAAQMRCRGVRRVTHQTHAAAGIRPVTGVRVPVKERPFVAGPEPGKESHQGGVPPRKVLQDVVVRRWLQPALVHPFAPAYAAKDQGH